MSAAERGLDLASEVRANYVLVRLSGRMDAEGVREISEEFDRATGNSLPVLVDLTGVTFIESLGVALLVKLAKQLRKMDLAVAVIPGGPVARILGIARLDRVLNVVFTREDAEQTFTVA